MRLPIGRIAAWLGRAIIGALVAEAADRLSRRSAGEPSDQRGDDRPDREQRPHDHEGRDA